MNRLRKKPNASILNFFQKVPRGDRSSPGDGLFVEGEYGDGDLYSSGLVTEERDGMIDEELMGLFEEETAVVTVVGEADADEGRGKRGGSVMLPTPVKGEGKQPLMVNDEESGDGGVTPTKSAATVKQKTECSPAPPPPPISKKRKMPFEMEEDDDEAEDAETGESKSRFNKYETNLTPPVLTNDAGNSNLSDAAMAALLDDEFIDDEMLNNDGESENSPEEGLDTPNGGGWEEREERRYLEMLQEQEDAGLQDVNDTPQCPICAESLEGMKEDVSCTRCQNYRPPKCRATPMGVKFCNGAILCLSCLLEDYHICAKLWCCGDIGSNEACQSLSGWRWW